MSDINEIRRVVIQELEDLAPQHAGKIQDSDRLIADLKLTGDDASVFVLLAEKRLGISAPARQWKNVSTVGEAIALLAAQAGN